MNPVSVAKLQDVHPKLRDLITQLDERLQLESIFLEVSEGLRSWARSDALYQQGRTTPGPIVTNAPAGHSWHNFGMAVDCMPELTEGTVDWNPSHPQWKRMEEVGVSLGLVSGANWIRIVDAPHFQLTGSFPVSPDDEVRQLFTDGGIEAVWDASGL